MVNSVRVMRVFGGPKKGLTFVYTYVMLSHEGGEKRMSPNENGMGRPFAGAAGRTEIVKLRMEPAEVADLDRLAEQLGTTRSGAIREGLRLLKDKTAQKN